MYICNEKCAMKGGDCYLCDSKEGCSDCMEECKSCESCELRTKFLKNYFIRY